MREHRNYAVVLVSISGLTDARMCAKERRADFRNGIGYARFCSVHTVFGNHSILADTSPTLQSGPFSLLAERKINNLRVINTPRWSSIPSLATIIPKGVTRFHRFFPN